jgi:ribosomal protein L35AE/L33A
LTPKEKTSKTQERKPKETTSTEKTKEKAKAKSKVTTKPKTKPAPKAEAKPKPKPKVKPKAKPKTKPKEKVKTKTEAKPKSKAKAKPKATRKPVKRPIKPPAPEIKPRRIPLAEPIDGVIMNFQRGSVTQNPHYGLIQLDGVDSIGKASAYIGRTVVLHFNEDISNTGHIIAAHGRRGILRARFNRKLAPEAIAKKVKVF